MAINKVIYGNQPLIDLTEDTVTADSMLSGVTAHGANGEQIYGTMSQVTPATATPLMDGTGAVGSSVKYAREDHVHPTDTSKAPTSHASTATTYGQGNASNFGHVKVSDNYTSSAGAASAGVAASSEAVYDTYSKTIHRKASLTISSSSWSGSGPYTQTITISGATITANTEVDIQPDATALAQLIADGVTAMFIENNNGTLTIYTIGAATTADITVQVTYYETV